MLPSVTRQDHSRISFASKAHQVEHLPPANLAGLVHDDDRPFSQFTLKKKTRDRCWRPESRLLHAHDLLTLRRKNDNISPGQLNLLDQFAQNKTLARSRATTKERNDVR